MKITLTIEDGAHTAEGSRTIDVTTLDGVDATLTSDELERLVSAVLMSAEDEIDYVLEGRS